MAIFLPVTLASDGTTPSVGASWGQPVYLGVNLAAVIVVTKVIVTANPTSVVINTPFGLTVNATDASNILATGYSGSATVAKASGPGTLSGTTTGTMSGGVLTFSNLLLDTVGTYTLTISSGSLTPATTIAFTVTLTAFTDTFPAAGSNLNGANWTYVAAGPMTQNSGVATGAGAGGTNFSLAEHLYGQVDGTISTTAISTTGADFGGNEATLVRSIGGSGQTATFVSYGGGLNDSYPGLVTSGEAGTAGHVQRAIVWLTGTTNAYKLSRISGGGSSQRYIGQRDGVINTVLTLQAALNATDAHAGILAADTKTIGAITIDGTTPASVPAASSMTPPIFAVDGNSLSALGFDLTDAQGWFTQVIPALITAGYDVTTFAIPGTATVQLFSNRDRFRTLYNAGRSAHKYFGWEGTNDLALSACDAAAGRAAFQNLIQLYAYHTATGWDTTGGTVIARTGAIPNGGTPTTFKTQQTLINGWLRQYGRYFLNHLADFSADPAFASVTGTYYNGDNVHLLAAGQARIASTISTALSATPYAYGPASSIGISPATGYNRCIFDVPIYFAAAGTFQTFIKASGTALYLQYATLDTAVSTPTVTLTDVTNGGSTVLGNMSGVSSGLQRTDLTLGHVYQIDVSGFDGGAAHSVQLQLFDVQTVGAAVRVAFVKSPYAGLVGAGNAFSTQPVLAAVDAAGNVATSYSGSVALTLLHGGGAALGGTTTATFSGGIATFATVAVDTAGGNYQLSAHSGSLTDAISDPFFVPAIVTHLAYSTQPANAVAGSAFTTQPVVQALKSDNTLDTSYTTNVTLAITGGTGTGGAALIGTVTLAMVAGVGTFTNVGIDTIGSGYTLTATSGSLTSAISSAFAVQATVLSDSFQRANVSGSLGTIASPDIFTNGSAYQSTTMGTAGITSHIANAGDGTTNKIMRYDAGVTATAVKITLASVYTGPGANDFIIAGRATSETTFVGFEMKFDQHFYPIKVVGGTYGVAGAGSPASVVYPFNGFPSVGDVVELGFSGTTMSLWVTRSGVRTNVYANYDISDYTPTGTQYGWNTYTPGNYTISNLTILAPSIPSGPPATHLAFSQQPIAIGKGLAFAAAPKVQALRADNSVDTGYTANVTLAIKSGTGGTAGAGATLGGTVTVACVAGVADFASAGVNINQGGTAYQLHATSGSITAIDSSSFDVADIADFGSRTSAGLGTALTGQTWTQDEAFTVAVSGGNASASGWPPAHTTSFVPGVSANGTWQMDVTFPSSGTVYPQMVLRRVSSASYMLFQVSMANQWLLYSTASGAVAFGSITPVGGHVYRLIVTGNAAAITTSVQDITAGTAAITGSATDGSPLTGTGYGIGGYQSAGTDSTIVFAHMTFIPL